MKSKIRVKRDDKTLLLARLKRMEGQMGGVTRMLQDDRYCVDVLTQVSAIRSALDAFSIQLLRNHLQGCVQTAILTGEGDASISEMSSILKKFVR